MIASLPKLPWDGGEVTTPLQCAAQSTGAPKMGEQPGRAPFLCSHRLETPAITGTQPLQQGIHHGIGVQGGDPQGVPRLVLHATACQINLQMQHLRGQDIFQFD